MAASQSPSTSQVGEDLSGADLNGLIINEQPDDLCVLDCRMGGDTLKSASRVRLPNVLARRLIAGSLQLSNVSPRLQDPSVVRVVIVPGDNATDAATSTALANLLRREGFRFRVLSESVDDVLGKYPALRASAGDETSTSATAATTTSQESRHSPPGGSCSSQSSTPASTNAAPNTGGPPVGYLNLGMAAKEKESSRCRSLCLETGTNEARVQEKARAEFPVEILPYLYLGNGETARNREVLDKHGITYIINVTTNLANEFEDDTRMHYLRISVDDNSSHNLTKFFTEAIAFIEAARMSGSACLVHCLAGISRSVTICLAYLMTVNKYTLEDAYDMVQNRNASIAPNFHFMGQLTDYERHLGIRSSCVGTYPSSAPRSPCAVEAAAATALLTPPPTSCSASPQSSIHSAKSFH